MSKLFLSSINLNKNEIQNAVLQVLGTAPGSPAVGQIYYDTVAGRMMVRGASAWIDDTARANHTGTQSADTLTDGTTNKAFLATERTKLAGIATGATANSTDAILLARANHTGTQSADTLTDGTTNKAFLATERTKLAGIATGATANSTDAILLARANHTGTQLAATISDFDTQVRLSRLDQMTAPTASVSFNSQKITNLLDGTVAQDAATYGQLQVALQGRDFKESVRVATTANVAQTSLTAIDGITLVAGDRILDKDCTTSALRGIWLAQTGAWTRPTDFDTSAKVTASLSVMVEEGTVNQDKQFTLTTNGAIVLGTTALTFAQTGAGTAYTQGTGISIAGSVISIDTAVVVRKYAVSFGDNAAVSFAISHGLATTDVTVGVFEVSSGAEVECDITRTSAAVVTLAMTIAPTTNQYRVVVQG